MPCYQINLVSVEFKNKNIDLILDSLKELGYKATFNELSNVISFVDKNGDTYSLRLNTGIIETRYGSREVINQLKRKYSELALNKSAKKNRWALRSLATNKYKAVKY